MKTKMSEVFGLNEAAVTLTDEEQNLLVQAVQNMLSDEGSTGKVGGVNLYQLKSKLSAKKSGFKF